MKPTDLRIFKSDALLLLTAAIWGFAFVAQRVGMDYVGPFTYNGVRFALGSVSLIPLIYVNTLRRPEKKAAVEGMGVREIAMGGCLAGVCLFMGASLQQIGLVYTTAGKAGFVTGLYVILVPLMGLIWKQRPGGGTWVGAVLAVIGMYLLCVTESFTVAKGDFLVFLGAFFWAAHVLILGWLSRKINALILALMQFSACSLLSLIVAFSVETVTLTGLMNAAIPIIYGGMFSVGVAYTLQVVAQKSAPPSHAAILLSLESVFAAFGGWLMLDEVLSYRGIIGCGLMLAGMLLSELQSFFLKRRLENSEAC